MTTPHFGRTLCINMPFQTRSSVRALLRHETDGGMLRRHETDGGILRRHETDCGMSRHEPEESGMNQTPKTLKLEKQESRHEPEENNMNQTPKTLNLEKQESRHEPEESVAWNGPPGGITINVSLQNHDCSLTSSTSMHLPTWCDAPQVKQEAAAAAIQVFDDTYSFYKEVNLTWEKWTERRRTITVKGCRSKNHVKKMTPEKLSRQDKQMKPQPCAVKGEEL